MRGLKVLVAVMTALLVAGTGLVAWGIARQAAGALAGGGALPPLTLPADSTVEYMTQYGEELALFITTPGGSFLYFYNPRRDGPPRVAAVQKEP